MDVLTIVINLIILRDLCSLSLSVLIQPCSLALNPLYRLNSYLVEVEEPRRHWEYFNSLSVTTKGNWAAIFSNQSCNKGVVIIYHVTAGIPTHGMN